MTVPFSAADRRDIAKATGVFERALSDLLATHLQGGRGVREVLGEPGNFAQRALAAVAPTASPWDELVGPFIRAEGVRARLVISRQAVAAKAARRRLLRVVTADGDHLYPVWQFENGRLQPGLAEVLAMFPESAVDGWTLAAWLRTPDPDLGEAPWNLLTRGEFDAVRVVARTAAQSLSA